MTDPLSGAWQAQRAAMGAFIRSQRELANMSLRELSRATQISNAYLSQVERGLHDPTLKVLTQIAEALHLTVEDLLREGAAAAAPGAPDQPGGGGAGSVEAAVLADTRLTAAEKDALLTVYRSYVTAHSERDGA